MIPLRILGITFSQIQAGAYALILSEKEGKRRIPIIIGTPEAQSIAIYLENRKPPRPLTHDLFITFVRALKAEITHINIYRYENGIFYSEIVIQSNEKSLSLDARTSDAIAIAIRSNAPIYIEKNILDEVAINMDDDDLWDDVPEEMPPQNTSSYETMSLEELQISLNEAISSEDYETASYLHELIKKLG